MILLLKSYLYRFVRTILSVPFCPIPFCPYTILSIPFCPYHFVRYHFVLEPPALLPSVTVFFLTPLKLNLYYWRLAGGDVCLMVDTFPLVTFCRLSPRPTGACLGLSLSRSA